jgi:hypothetical protein
MAWKGSSSGGATVVPEPGRSTTCSPPTTSRHGSTGWTGGRPKNGEGAPGGPRGVWPARRGHTVPRGDGDRPPLTIVRLRSAAPEAPNLSMSVPPDFGDTPAALRPRIGFPQVCGLPNRELTTDEEEVEGRFEMAAQARTRSASERRPCRPGQSVAARPAGQTGTSPR